MIANRLIKNKKITALFFVAVMFFIQGVQVFHKHSPNLSYDLSKNEIGLKYHQANQHQVLCSICIFQFYKDSDITDIFIYTSPLIGFVSNCRQVIISFKCSSLHFVSGRAPPCYS